MDEAGLRSVLSQNIKRFRQRKGWTQAKLAEKMDISTNYLSDIETKRGWVSPFSLIKLAIALDIQVYELFKPEESSSADVLSVVNKCIDDLAISLKISFEKNLEDSIKRIRKNL